MAKSFPKRASLFIPWPLRNGAGYGRKFNYSGRYATDFSRNVANVSRGLKREKRNARAAPKRTPANYFRCSFLPLYRTFNRYDVVSFVDIRPTVTTSCSTSLRYVSFFLRCTTRVRQPALTFNALTQPTVPQRTSCRVNPLRGAHV